jgi:hypothetical protein
MRSLVLVVSFIIMGTFIGVLQNTEPQASAAVVMEGVAAAPVAPGEASPAAPMQQPPKVTVRVGGGRDKVKIGNSEQARGRKGRVQNPGLGTNPNRPGQTSLTVEGQGVSMADLGTSGEGRLTRIHVDADDDLTVVIGFYDAIDAEQPVNAPETYSCKRCAGVLVCGVDPQCMN